MKGPANRLKLIVRRMWQCPRCQRRVLTAGSVVFQACTCAPTEPAPAWMQLIEEPRHKPRSEPPRDAAPDA
jgi:hypothetical protein